MKVLVAEPLDAGAVARLAGAGHEVVERHGLQGDALIAALARCRGLVVRGGTRVTGDVLRAASSLRVVVRAGTGLDNVDLGAARERDIDVLNTPGANAISVAELVFAMLLAFERRIVPAASALRAGRWEKSGAGRELSGRRLGLLGFGRVGREVARRARVRHGCGRAIRRSFTARRVRVGAPLAARGSLAARVDVLSLHTPLMPETRHIVGSRELARMKSDALLVNTARGELVDPDALRAALESGRLRGAVLDVFAQEPTPADDPLVALPNVLALPHLGAATHEAQRRAGAEAASLLIAALAALPE